MSFKKPLIIVGLCILGLFFASFDFRNSSAGVIQYLKQVEGYIGDPPSFVEAELGSPDDKTSDTNVLVYYVQDKSGDISGYRLFGIWGEEIGCYTEKNVIAEEEVISLYQRVVDFMGESGRNVSLVSGYASSHGFSDNHRLSRRLDNMWEVDMQLRNLESTILFFVYHHENRSCHQELLIEAQRLDESLEL